MISNASSADELCKTLGADSLYFISVKGLLESLDLTAAAPPGDCGFCLGCFTGEYPIPVSYKHVMCQFFNNVLTRII